MFLATTMTSSWQFCCYGYKWPVTPTLKVKWDQVVPWVLSEVLIFQTNFQTLKVSVWRKCDITIPPSESWDLKTRGLEIQPTPAKNTSKPLFFGGNNVKNCQLIPVMVPLSNHFLVGGWTNPFEKYQSNWVHLPQIGVKIPKIFELPPTTLRPQNHEKMKVLGPRTEYHPRLGLNPGSKSKSDVETPNYGLYPWKNVKYLKPPTSFPFSLVGLPKIFCASSAKITLGVATPGKNILNGQLLVGW